MLYNSKGTLVFAPPPPTSSPSRIKMVCLLAIVGTLLLNIEKVNFAFDPSMELNTQTLTCISVSTVLCLLLHSTFSIRVFKSARVLSNTAHCKALSFSSNSLWIIYKIDILKK